MTEKVCVVGLGYVGLPLACLCAKKRFEVSGLDSNAAKVRSISQGKSPIRDAALSAALKKAGKRLSATASPQKAVTGASTVIICVPTPAKKNKPDLGFIRKAAVSIAPHLKAGKKPLVLVESTVYPGTVEGVVKPILEKGSGLKAGEGFFLGHCPERIDPGNKRFTLERIPRVLACLSHEGEKRALGFYRSILDAKVTVLGSVKSAEAVKVVENTFRDVNIAFVNELAKSFDRMGVDLLEVVKGASTKPFGFMPFYPGPGVGGHCIAQDPYYLIASAHDSGFEHRFLRLARKINNSMPRYVASLVERALQRTGVEKEGACVAVLGLSYKPGVDDTRKSPSLKIVSILRSRGIRVKAFDPFVREKSTAQSLEKAVKGADLVVLATHHPVFLKRLSPDFLAAHRVKAVVDARNALDGKGIKKKGIFYKGLGR